LVGEKPARRGLYVALGSLAALAVGGLVVMRSLGSSPIRPEVSLVPSVVTTAAEVTAPSAAPSAERTQVDANVPAVRVSITTEPPNAELYFDGNRIANPFDAELPQTKEPRLLQARLAGFETLEQELVLLYPQKVRLTLIKTGASKPTPGKAAGPASSPEAAALGAAQPVKQSAAATPAAVAPAVAPAPPPVAASPTPAPAPANTTAPATKGRGLKTPF
jgi:translation initiation factor IF-2